MEHPNHSIPILETDRKYWLVRTNAGDYYEEFFNEGYIGIGWNNVSLDDLNLNRELSDIISEKYPDERHNYVANQIQIFVNGIQEGDIVLIPSKNSYYITFGEVLDTYCYEEESLPEGIEDEEILDPDYEGRCLYKKRKLIHWIKTVRRDSLDPYLFKLIYSHHTISDASSYAPYIDRELHSFFIKGDKAHLILHVKKRDDINAMPLLELINGSLHLAEDFMFEDLDITPQNVEIKLNVQSPGPIELIGNVQTIFSIAAGYIAIFGGNVKILGLELQTDGIWGKISQLIQDRHTRRLEERRVGVEEKRLSMEEIKLVGAVQELEVRLPQELEAKEEKGIK